ANIISHNLRIDPEILLLGGTEIDIAELYRVSQQSMDKQQKEMNQLNDSLSVLNTNFAQLHIQMERMQESINEQKKLFKEQGKELVEGKNKIISQSKELFDQQEQIEQKKELLEKQKESIHEQLVELSEQQSYIDRQLTKIKESEIVLDSLKGEINDKNYVLSKQSDIIYRQKVMVIMAVVIGLLSLIMLVSLISSYRYKTKKNRILTQQKIQIEKANLKLETTVKKLYDTITKLHETQTQLVASEKMASLGVLTAGIAHEINNPVNFIYTGINSLKNDYNDLLPLLDTIQVCSYETDYAFLKNKILELKSDIDYEEILEIIPQTIEDIHIGAERAADIIRGLRNFSRIDKDNIQDFDVHEGIDSALLLLQNKFKNHIKIEKNYSQLPKIECYPGKLNQVFLNIISNAIDAIDKEGLIIIRTHLNDDKINIEIEDNGKGISPQNINNIFDPFFTTKSVGKGVGLGLSISFGLIKDHKGSVEVNSTENIGTVFSISLPCILND
ncbi:MAG: ATP-binding protein, partial [Prolixibacteraceae bacterium]|nr:ATP-binding protein [Prolixibacteraceae bacterium]